MQKNKSNTSRAATIGLLIWTATLIVTLSLLSFSNTSPSKNWLGLVGYKVGWGMQYTFGLGSYLIMLYSLFIGWQLMRHSLTRYWLKTFYFFVFLFSSCILLNVLAETSTKFGAWFQHVIYLSQNTNSLRYNLGGVPCYYLFYDLPSFSLNYLFHTSGVAIIFSISLITSFILLINVHPLVILSSVRNRVIASTARKIRSFVDYIFGLFSRIKFKKKDSESLFKILGRWLSSRKKEDLEIKDGSFPFKPPYESINKKEKTPKTPKIKKVKLDKPVIFDLTPGQYQLPPLSLLTSPKKVDNSSVIKNLEGQSQILEETLFNFGIEAKVIDINCGPTITSFEVQPAIGVKVQKIKALENDIALNMRAKSIRIIAPIPGKAAVGIEVPNIKSQEVNFKEMLSDHKQDLSKFNIPLFLGKSVHGESVIADLTKMPHCIIAGATGSGKSVCINTLIMSILMRFSPDEVKLMLVDPKKVELMPYSNLPHMIAPVITEPRWACTALNWLVKEMEYRYEVLKQLEMRNILDFNSRDRDEKIESALKIKIPEKMHYLVCIIDELADLMMVSENNIEAPIARIAQMARAVGIHLILATQRPSREIITGLIKANFPVRISFKVASRVNSQIILDSTGAESLLGNGDMLFLPPGSSHLIRSQGAFVRDKDIKKVISFVNNQANTNYLIKSFDRTSFGLDTDERTTDSSDSLYQDALELVTNTGNASTTFLQRKLKVGYARAASLMDQLEESGIVSAPDGSRARKVLASELTDTE